MATGHTNYEPAIQRDNGVSGGGSTPQIPSPFVPVRPVSIPPILSPVSPIAIAPILKTVTTTGSTTTNTSGKDGVPGKLLTVQAVQTPVKEQSYVDCNVTVSFTRNTSDKNFGYVEVWFTNYHGNPNPQLMASGNTSPINFVCDATKETVGVYAQTVSPLGLSAGYQFAAHCSLILTGTVGAPPAPTISQSLVGTPLGYQFGFNQVLLPANDIEVISAYNIYRNTSNNSATATLISTMVPNPNLTGALTYSDTVIASLGLTYYYWVSAVNSASFESTLTPAQSGAVQGSIGSLPPSISTPFKIVATATSITLSSSPSALFTRADGTTLVIGQTSTAVTGLPSGNNMFFFPRWNESTQALEFVSASDATIPNITGVIFNGSTQWIETATDASVPSTFSVELWWKGTTAGALFSFSDVQGTGTPGSSCLQVQTTSAGEVEMSIYNSASWENLTTSGASVLDSTWHHIVCVYAQATGIASIFVDGLNTSNGSTFWNATVGTMAGVIGYWHFGFIAGFSGAPVTSNLFVNGQLSLIALYDTALIAHSVATHLQAYCNLGETSYLAEVTYDSAVNLWKLNETTGTTAADSIGSNTGTYEGTPTLNQISGVVTVLGTPAIAWPYNSAIALQLQNLRNWTPLSPTGISASTLSSGSTGSSTSSGGGSTNGGSGYTGGSGGSPSRGGGLCFTGNTKIKTQRGDVAISKVRAGDFCLTAKGTWAQVLALISHEAERHTLQIMPNAELVTFKHKILNDGKWVNAGEVFQSTIEVNESLFTLAMRSDEPQDQMLSATTERSFTLSSGVIAHNNTFIK
jgi:hypothetical protein